MEPSIKDLLQEAAIQNFVGRDAELKLIKRQLNPDKNQWNVLHFHGMKGIGKTALLNKFMNISLTSTVIYMDTDKEIDSPDQFLDAITKQLVKHNNSGQETSLDLTKTPSIDSIIDYLNKIAINEPPLVLIFDSLELWKPIIKWLFHSFIPKLSANIRLVSAGREPLNEAWLLTNPWGLFVKNIQLTPLDKEDAHQYLIQVGIVDPKIRYTIVMLSNGIPFAMNLCCHVVMNEANQQMDTAAIKQIVRGLWQTILDELDITSHQRSLLDAASVVAYFDKELLTHITNQPLSYEDFDQFCQIQIIMKAKDGWGILDGIRNWIQSDFKEHSPDLFNRYKKRALEMLHRRWLAADLIRRRSLFLENVYAVENNLFQEYYFLGDGTEYDIRTALQEDILPIMEIWKNRHLNTLESINDGTEQEKLIQSVWELEPSAIKAFWKKGRLVGFTTIVSFTQEAREIFLKNDLYKNYLLNTKTEENERLFWIGATANKDDYETLNAIYRYCYEHTMGNYLCTVMFPTDYDVSGLISLGFNELPWAASVTPSGKKFRMLQADFREISLLQLLTTSYPIKAKKNITSAEAVELIKKLMLSFHDFESDQKLFKDLIEVIDIQDDHPSGNSIRMAVLEVMNEIKNRTEKDQLMMRLIELTYIERIGTNDIVAKQFHLSISTYYRYIRKGIEKITLSLISNRTP